MKSSELKKYPLVYIATPFTLYEAGLPAAYADACRLTAALAKAGIVNAHSPIVEAFSLVMHSDIDPLDMSIWTPFCAARMAKSDALLVAMMDGWEASSGIRHEREEFVLAGKPVFFLNVETLELDPLSGEERESILIAARAKLMSETRPLQPSDLLSPARPLPCFT